MRPLDISSLPLDIHARTFYIYVPPPRIFYVLCKVLSINNDAMCNKEVGRRQVNARNIIYQAEVVNSESKETNISLCDTTFTER